MCTVHVGPPMGFAVLLWFMVTALSPYYGGVVSSQVAFECGPHGKFEYCIDEFPGCVVGCHCHPGYYFDTDSKICEPNIKLTQQFRRQYVPEPTPTAIVYPTYPTPTTTEHLDDKDHELTKDTDELGDWLYNQFFKTIESQIISNSNKSNSNSNEKAPTRRAGGGPAVTKSKRKVRKSIRGRKKKKHTKERGLRRKLLRITEDDSLFDDSSSDSDSDSEYSDSSSDSSDSSDDSSSGKERKSEEKKTSDTDCGDDHGHKKVIIFNRRPKPPLPSFIFLPNMDTPYYPPIGLPPPPLVPMYPMVPVPPMAPAMFPPFPGPPKCEESSTTTSTTATTETTHHTDAPPHPPHHETDPEPHPETTTEAHSDTTPESTPDQNPELTTESNPEESTPESNPEESTPESTTVSSDVRRNRLGKRLKRPNLGKLFARVGEPGKQKKLTQKQQNKLMQKLREKLKGKRRHEVTPAHEKTLEEFQDEHLNSDVVPNISEDDTPHKRIHQEDHEETYVPKLEDVDFKYLSELIHRVNQSKSKSRPPLPFDLSEDLKQLQKLQSSLPTRRNMGSYIPTRHAQRQVSDDIYYSNLGRRIASMIRNADSEVEIQFSKDTERANLQNQFHSVLNENSFLPRSFWERSVRSPVLQKIPISEYLDESRTLKHSNEKSLIKLENEFEMYASTRHPLSLHDIENILNTIEKAHATLRQPMASTKRSNASMNVNLLPKHVRPARRHTGLFHVPEKVQYITEHPHTPIPSLAYVDVHPAVHTNASVFHEPRRMYNAPYSDYWIFNAEPVEQRTRPKPVVNQTSKPKVRTNQVYNTNPVRPPLVDVVRPKDTENSKARVEYLHFLKSTPLTIQTPAKKHEKKLSKYKNLNYFTGNKHYMFEAFSNPVRQQQLLLPPFKSQISPRSRSESSYFYKHGSGYFE